MPAGSHACDLLLEQRLDENDQVIYGTPAEADELVLEEVYPAFYRSPAFQRFTEVYLWDDAAMDRLLALYGKRFGDTYARCYRLEEIITDLLLTRDPALHLIPEEPVAPEPPQLKRARELKNLRAEVEADIERNSGISVDEIKAKRKLSADYNRVYNEVMRPQAPESTLPEFSQELNDFAIAFNAATRESLNLVGGFRTVGGIRYGSDTFEKMLAQASAYGLIRG